MSTSIVRARIDAGLLLAGIAVTDLAVRVVQVALPLVVLTATGSAAATGLVAGASGLPVLLSPWWARRLRDRVRSGRALAACYVGEVGALVIVATWATRHDTRWAVLLAAGFVLGLAEALSGPGRDAMVADLGDVLGPDRALTLLTTRELFRRIGMVVGPALGGIGVATGHAVALLWAEVGAVLVALVLALPVGRVSDPGSGAAVPSIRSLLRSRPDVLAGWLIRGTGCLLWFGFTLGLSLLGAERGRPGAYLAAGMTAYGIGSIAGTLVTVPLLRVLPVLPAIAGAWAVTGACWLVMAASAPTPWATGSITAAGLVSGVGVVIGNAGITAQITRGSTGGERRALLTGQNVVVSASSSAGLLGGGLLLAAVGPTVTLGITGAATAGVALGVWAVRMARVARVARVARGQGRATTGPRGRRRETPVDDGKGVSATPHTVGA